jgi:hypothetical protein
MRKVNQEVMLFFDREIKKWNTELTRWESFQGYASLLCRSSPQHQENEEYVIKMNEEVVHIFCIFMT